MKTCIVCGKNFDENVNGACPRCQFPAIAVLGGAEDELIRFARQYRKDYLTDMRFGVVCTTWKASGDRLVSDRNEYVYLPTAPPLPSRTCGATVSWPVAPTAAASTCAWPWRRPDTAGSGRSPFPI